jgi:hypothetical protein
MGCAAPMLKCRPPAAAPRTIRLLAAAALLGWAVPAAADVSFLQTPPDVAVPGQPVVLGGQVSGAERLSRLVLFYRTGHGDFRQLDFELNPPDTYVVVIPGDEIQYGRDRTASFLEYYVVAYGFGGTTSNAFASPDSPASIRIGEPLKPGETGPTGPSGPSVFSHADEGPPVSVATGSTVTPILSPTGVTVMTADAIRSLGLRTLADLAAILPGLSVSRDVQGFWHVAVRGRSSDAELVVLYDGMRLNNPYDGKVNWDLPLENVERVEIQNGAGAALDGPGAFAVISIIPIRRDGVMASVSGGAAMSSGGPPGAGYDGHLNAGHTFGRLRLFLDADLDSRAASAELVKADALPRSGSAGPTTDRRLAAGGGILAQVAVGTESYLYLDLRGSYEQRPALLGAVDVLDPNSSLNWDTARIQLGGHFVANNWTISPRLFADEQITDRRLGLFPVGATVDDVTATSEVSLRTALGMTTAGAQFSAEGKFGQFDALTLGFDLQRQSIVDFTESASVPSPLVASPGDLSLPGGVQYPQQDPNYATRLMGGAFIQNVWRPLDLLRLTLNVRGDVSNGLSGLTIMPSARAAVVIHPADWLSIRGAATRAVRMPTFEELLTVVPLPAGLNDGLPTGFNPQAWLQPVTLTGGEVGLDIAEGIGPGRIVARVTGFLNRYDDPIVLLDSGSGPAWVNRPGGEQSIGIEGELRYDWQRYGTVFANTSWTRGQDLASATATPAFSWLTDVPQLRANGGAVIPIGKVLTLAATVTYGSERRNDTRTVEEAALPWDIPPYVLLAATIRSAPILGWLDLAASVYQVSLAGAYLDPVPRPDQVPGLLPREGISGLVTLRATY